ncbi:MAG: hypothetical protein ABI567_01890, partial [Gammaproteobacteria bacterium]
MQSWVKKTLIGVFGATLFVSSLSSCTRSPHGSGPVSDERVAEIRGKMIERVSGKLDLNEPQRQKLGVLADEMIALRTALRGNHTQPRTEMTALIAGKQFDRARAQALLDEKTEAV